MEYYNEALLLAEKYKFIKQEMLILFNIGEAYKIAEKHEKSCHYYSKSLEIAKELKDKQMEKLIKEQLSINN
ncbi:hypothetical protein C5S36_03860 [Candidatus Methanophagaceae archaeon]|nr:hypothetical protein C5S36_03860 [Methanophagales archaeon]